VADDDRAVMDRLAALEAEVKADVDAQRARKEAALVKVREERAKQQVERDDLRQRQAALVARKPRERAPEPRASSGDDDDGDGLAGALELAGRANRVKTELARKPKKGEKSWVKSGIASMAFGPLGWLYAGSWREAVPASAAWLAAAALVMGVLPSMLMPLLLPALMVLMPLSGIAGVVYAMQYNRTGQRQRLFGEDKKQLREKND
jgi:hypothetical protein